MLWRAQSSISNPCRPPPVAPLALRRPDAVLSDYTQPKTRCTPRNQISMGEVIHGNWTALRSLVAIWQCAKPLRVPSRENSIQLAQDSLHSGLDCQRPWMIREKPEAVDTIPLQTKLLAAGPMRFQIGGVRDGAL